MIAQLKMDLTKKPNEYGKTNISIFEKQDYVWKEKQTIICEDILYKKTKEKKKTKSMSSDRFW